MRKKKIEIANKEITNSTNIPWKKIFIITYLTGMVMLLGYGILTNVLHIPIQIPACTFRRVMGFYCPGCGLTRSIKALLRANILLSVYYAPHVIYTYMITTWAFISFLIEERTERVKNQKKNQKIQKLMFCMKDRYVWMGLVLFLGNWIMRNILLLVFHIPTL